MASVNWIAMSFYKDYPGRKDHRKSYRDSRRFDRSCCNNKSCDWCKSNRTHFDKRHRLVANEKLIDYMKHGI